MPDEVEEFLRRVAQMRAQAEAQSKGRQPQPPNQKKPKQQRQQPQQPRPQSPATRPHSPSLSAGPVLPEVVDAELADRSDRVSRLVDQDLRETQQIAEHSSRLGAQVDAANSKMAAHLHQVFDHKLGHLKATAIEQTAEALPAAAELTADQVMRMLRSPTSMRDAIVMAEVLRRPEW